MAFKITKLDQKKIADLIDQLTAQRQAVIAEATKYNEIIEEARELVTGIGSDMAEAFSDRSEKWQEGERGTATQTWIELYENIDLTEIDIEDENDESVGALEELPIEPDY